MLDDESQLDRAVVHQVTTVSETPTPATVPRLGTRWTGDARAMP